MSDFRLDTRANLEMLGQAIQNQHRVNQEVAQLGMDARRLGMAEQQMREQQQRRETANVLAQQLGQDPQEPGTANRLLQISALDPELGQVIGQQYQQQHQRAMQSERLRMDQASQESESGQRNLAISRGALEVGAHAYEGARQQGMTEEAARKRGSESWSRSLNDAVASGAISLETKAMLLRQGFDPLGYMAHRTEQERLRAEQLDIQRQRLLGVGARAQNRGAGAPQKPSEPTADDTTAMAARYLLESGHMLPNATRGGAMQMAVQRQAADLERLRRENPEKFREVWDQIPSLFTREKGGRAETGAAVAVGGQIGRTVTPMMTAYHHLGTFSRLAGEAGLSDAQIMNRIQNWAKTQTGNPDVTNMAAARTAVIAELSAYFKGGQATEGEIAEWEKAIMLSQSPRQIAGVVRTVQALMEGRLRAMRDVARGVGASIPALESVTGETGHGGTPKKPGQNQKPAKKDFSRLW